ncbi:MAG: hypothetical protein A2X59_09690 [Nitrospirae bacterium GWC2_42_7]|nr:MAG: hypothetical protein A2X59_09690 [Nitrospirae bacterium GWC2_42_7]
MNFSIKHIFLIFLLFTLHPSLVTAVNAEEIKSRASVVMDAETGRVLYAKNPDLKLMPASTTKLMTALIVVEKADLSDVVTVSREAVNTAPTRSGLKAGDRVTIETLLYAALMKSANDAAVALAEAVGGSTEEFVRMMNTKAIAIGANDTRFINPHGLPGKGQYITAYDLSKIMRQAIKYPVLREIMGTRVTEVSTEKGKTIFVKNTNKLLWSDEELLGGKTGYTRKAKHCFVSAGERDKETIIVALLGAPTRDLLWKETEDLMAFGSKVMSNQEEPVVYVTRSDYDSLHVKKATYTKKTQYKSPRKKLPKAKTKAKVKSKTVVSKTRKAGKKHTAVKKTPVRAATETKKVQKTDITKKEPDDTEG